jgi:hypothetical protein
MRQKDGRISVEMTKPNGRRRIIPDFRDEAEANAWIIQMQRLIEAAQPHLLGLPRRVPDAPASVATGKKMAALSGGRQVQGSGRSRPKKQQRSLGTASLRRRI